MKHTMLRIYCVPHRAVAVAAASTSTTATAIATAIEKTSISSKSNRNRNRSTSNRPKYTLPNTNTELTVVATFSRDTNTSDRKRFVVPFVCTVYTLCTHIYLYVYFMAKQKHRQFKYLTVAAARRRRERQAFQHVQHLVVAFVLWHNFKEIRLYIISRLIVLSIGLHRDTSFVRFCFFFPLYLFSREAILRASHINSIPKTPAHKIDTKAFRLYSVVKSAP